MKWFASLFLLLWGAAAIAQGPVVNRIRAGNLTLPQSLSDRDSTMGYFNFNRIVGNFGFVVEFDSMETGAFVDSITISAYPRILNDGNTFEPDGRALETLWEEEIKIYLTDGTEVHHWSPTAQKPRLLTNQYWWKGIPVWGVTVKVKNESNVDRCFVTRFEAIAQ